MGNRVYIFFRGFWCWWWRCHCLGLLLEQYQQQWRFLLIRLSCLNVSQICSAPPVEFVAKDGFAKFPDFGQFWRAASRRFRPLSHAPPSLPQTNFVRMRFRNCLHLLQFMWYFSLTLTITIIIIIIITILKLDFVHAAQNYAHKLSLASQRADSHGHILSKSSTNLEKWGGVQKKVSLSHRMVHLPVNDFMRTSFDFSIASSLNQRRIRVCCRIAAQIYLSPYPNFL